MLHRTLAFAILIGEVRRRGQCCGTVGYLFAHFPLSLPLLQLPEFGLYFSDDTETQTAERRDE